MDKAVVSVVVWGLLTFGAGRATAGEPAPLERVKVIALEGPVGGLDHLALDAERGRLFVANTSGGTLDIVDLEAGKLVKQVSGQGKIRGLHYSAQADRIFAGVGSGGVCNTFDGETYELIKSVPLGDDADNLRYDPRSKKIYVVHADKELAVIDTKGFGLLSPIALPVDLGGLAIESARPRLYVNAKEAGLVIVIDTASDRIIERFSTAPLGGNAAVAIDEPRHRLYVGCRKAPALAVMDTETGKIVAKVPIPGDVDDVSYDQRRGRIYASCGEGAIAVIKRSDPEAYASLATIRTVKGARTSIGDPEKGRLYLAVPRSADRTSQANPEVWVYEARP